jgi:hypothetical protein
MRQLRIWGRNRVVVRGLKKKQLKLLDYVQQRDVVR